MNPLAFFLTWTTYASWLPGDDRGWVRRGGVFHSPRASLARHVTDRLLSEPVRLNHPQRRVVADVIEEHCRFRGWSHLSTACRSNHVHVIISAPQICPRDVLRSLKARVSRRLSEEFSPKKRWWTKGGSRRLIFTEADLADLLTYVNECQDTPKA